MRKQAQDKLIRQKFQKYMLYQWLIFVSIFMFGETMLRIFINDPVINIFSMGWVMSLLLFLPLLVFSYCF